VDGREALLAVGEVPLPEETIDRVNGKSVAGSVGTLIIDDRSEARLPGSLLLVIERDRLLAVGAAPLPEEITACVDGAGVPGSVGIFKDEGVRGALKIDDSSGARLTGSLFEEACAVLAVLVLDIGPSDSEAGLPPVEDGKDETVLVENEERQEGPEHRPSRIPKLKLMSMSGGTDRVVAVKRVMLEDVMVFEVGTVVAGRLATVGGVEIVGEGTSAALGA
jgi:hypothetical protein